MTFSKPNASNATRTKNRTPDSVTPVSGLCTTCLDGCPGYCEVGTSAVRGAEAIYPQPFGATTSASQKDYPLDMSHFNIMGTAVGAVGIKADSDVATFPNVNIEARLGKDKGIKLKMPFVIPGLGSTFVAAHNWEGLAIGSALAGTALTIGENVCGMDMKSEIKKGKVVNSPDLEERIKLFRDWQKDGYGEIILQNNVEDSRLGVFDYGIKELGIRTVELKWGQGAKDIGGEVKIKDLAKAQELKRRGYIVLPDPLIKENAEAFQRSFSEFERHSRVGMVERDSFMKAVDNVRELGAKYVFLKTGAYRPADLARAVKFASDAELDVLTIDGAGGGTGMSPWRMMNEWGVPTVEILSLAYQYLKKLADKGKYVPDLVVAGGFTLEDHLFKGLALCAPFAKAVGMGRSPITAAMVGRVVGQAIKDGKTPNLFSSHGESLEQVFLEAHNLKKQFNGEFEKIPYSAIGLYTYYKRLEQGLRQLMCGERKFALEHLTRDDICALTKEAAEVSGITYIMDVDKAEAERILEG